MPLLSRYFLQSFPIPRLPKIILYTTYITIKTFYYGLTPTRTSNIVAGKNNILPEANGKNN